MGNPTMVQFNLIQNYVTIIFLQVFSSRLKIDDLKIIVVGRSKGMVRVQATNLIAEILW